MPASKSLVAIMATLAAIAMDVPAAVEANQDNLVPDTRIDGRTLTFDWPAVEIGVASYEEGPTGVAVDVRGGGPGTVNTDTLRLGYGRAFTDAIVFSGGSCYGEEAITAVATSLKDDGARSGEFSNLAFVAGAIIYDFGGRRFNESIRTSSWLRARCGRHSRACSRSGLKAPDEWPCKARISAAMRIPDKGAHSARSVQRKSQLSSS